MRTTIAICQFDMAWCDVGANLAKAERMTAGCDADVIVLPEMFATGFVTDSPSAAQRPDGAVVEWMKRTAAARDCAVTGSAVIADGTRTVNRMLFVKPCGEIVWYDKRHLFSIGGEDEFISAGSGRTVVEFRGVRYLLQICYDLRFPVWSRNRGDYDAAIYSASWAAARRDAWNTLLRARAIENEAYVIGVNRTGADPAARYAGDSAVVDYKGGEMAYAGAGECVATAVLDTDALADFRRDFPAWRDADEFEIKL